MNETNTPLKVFLCHALDDTPKTRELYEYLKQRGIQPWLDKEDLLPGQDWEIEIPKALEASDVVIICLTKNSVEKEGYIHKEIRFAVEKALEMPEGRTSLIPVKFEECEIPSFLKRYQWVDLTSRNGYSRLMEALKKRASELNRKPVELSGATSSEGDLMGKTSSLNSDRGEDILSGGTAGASREIVGGGKPAELNFSRQHNSISEKKGLEAENQKLPTRGFPWKEFLGFLGVVLVAYLGFLGVRQQTTIPIDATQTKEARLSATIVQNTQPPTDTPQPTLTSVPTITPTQFICPYQAQTEHETIVNLIKAEAEAVNREDLAIINTIFAPNADFYDYAIEPPKHWNGPLDRYEKDLFQTTEFRGVEHFDILPVGPGIDGNTAYYTSGSKGSYLTSEGTWNDFFNSSLISMPPAKFGSDHWLLRKNDKGCWIIVRLDFNAGHIEFP